MLIVCPDCLKEFFVELKTIQMLGESFKRNPNLKFVCTECGWGKWIERRKINGEI